MVDGDSRSGYGTIEQLVISFIYLKPVNLFQKMTAPEGEGTERRSPGTPNGDVMVHSDEERERYDYLETNFKYPLMFIVISSTWVT